MNIEAPRNKNYCATVVALSKFVTLPNCDNVKAALIFGNSVIVSKDVQEGAIGLFFPVETALSKEFAGNNNLFRKDEFGNVDPEKKGFFEQHGRVKAMKFRGHKSEGFWIPMESLSYLGVDTLPVGTEFDKIGEHEICKKYTPKHNPYSAGGNHAGRARQARLTDALVDNQFRFHPDTENLRKNVGKISPYDYISISDKWHGTSAVFANVLVKRQLPWYEKLARYLGVNILESVYGSVYSSRKVVKAVNGVEKNSNHFYSEDIWGVVAKEVESVIPKGFTVYGEIVGYTPNGQEIQPGYHYGCQPGQHRFLAYRVTVTTADGIVVELHWQQMKEFCGKYGLEMVKELAYGRARDLFPSIPVDDNWHDNFLNALCKVYVHDEMCPHNNKEVPAEGVVLRIDRLGEAEAYKLKNFRFLKWETEQLDKNVVDMETVESEG